MRIAIKKNVKLHKIAIMLAVLILVGLNVQSAHADPLLFSNVVALQNGNSTKVDLFSNPGATLLGSQITFNVDISGTLGIGQVDTLRIIYSEQGSQPMAQDFQIPLFGTIQPPFTLVFSILSPGATFQGVPAALTVDLLNSSPDFQIPGGQLVNSYTYSFNVAQPMPEPATLVALATGLAALGVRSLRRD